MHSSYYRKTCRDQFAGAGAATRMFLKARSNLIDWDAGIE
jgi:hypothetical protein